MVTVAPAAGGYNVTVYQPKSREVEQLHVDKQLLVDVGITETEFKTVAAAIVERLALVGHELMLLPLHHTVGNPFILNAHCLAVVLPACCALDYWCWRFEPRPFFS